MISYCTGANGFLGGRLFQKLDGNKVGIPHGKLDGKQWFDIPSRIFFVGAYGNMAHHRSVRTMVQANVIQPWIILQAAMPEFFMYVSSSSVNLSVQTPYSRTKRAAEQMLQALPTYCIVRPFSITGVGEQKEHLIPRLIHSAMTGEPMPFYPHATHDFVDVEDVVDGMLMLAEQKRTGIFELGCCCPVTNSDVKGLVERITGKTIHTTSMDGRSFDNKLWFCREPAEGWKPKKNLEQSITEMVEAYE